MGEKKAVAASFEQWLEDYVKAEVKEEIAWKYPQLLKDLEEQKMIHAEWDKRREAQGRETGKNMSYGISYSSQCAELRVEVKEKDKLIEKLEKAVAKRDSLVKKLRRELAS